MMAKSKSAKKSKKETKDAQGTQVATLKSVNDDIIRLQGEIEDIRVKEIVTRRKAIQELRKSLISLKVECSCENLKKIPGSNRAQCQNSECGRVVLLQG